MSPPQLQSNPVLFVYTPVVFFSMAKLIYFMDNIYSNRRKKKYYPSDEKISCVAKANIFIKAMQLIMVINLKISQKKTKVLFSNMTRFFY